MYIYRDYLVIESSASHAVVHRSAMPPIFSIWVRGEPEQKRDSQHSSISGCQVQCISA